jgi:hypothetical protein
MTAILPSESDINETKATNALRTIALVRPFRLTQRLRRVEQNVVPLRHRTYNLPWLQASYVFET